MGLRNHSDASRQEGSLREQPHPGGGARRERFYLPESRRVSFITTQLTQSERGCGPEEVTGARAHFFQANVPAGLGEVSRRERCGKESTVFLMEPRRVMRFLWDRLTSFNLYSKLFFSGRLFVQETASPFDNELVLEQKFQNQRWFK